LHCGREGVLRGRRPADRGGMKGRDDRSLKNKGGNYEIDFST
jgi:hypothetical protein